MNVTQFDDLVRQGKSKILSLFSYHTQEKSGMTPSESAAHLTHRAIEWNLVASRTAIPGETLSAWSQSHRNNKVPAWALSAAVLVLLIDYHWIPETSAQRCVCASVLYREYGDNVHTELSGLFHSRCERDGMSEYLDLARQSRATYLANKLQS
ncbi:hypothetical protein V9N52_003701 [Vibrio navarrensis]